jgi:hypothetical protein
LKRPPQGIGNAHCLDDQRMKLLEDRRVTTSLIVLLVASPRHDDQTAVGKARKLAVYGPHSATGQTDELGALEPAVGLSKEETRHARAQGALFGQLWRPFDDGQGGPGGWWLLTEPELHFGEAVVGSHAPGDNLGP